MYTATINKYNYWISESLSIAVQITFIFAFLTLFFFAYVQQVEQAEFISQLDLIMNSLMDDIGSDIKNIIKYNQSIDNENLVLLMSGMIDTVEEKISIDSKSDNAGIAIQNKKIKTKALCMLLIVIITVVIISVIVLLLGFYIKIDMYVKEAMLVVIFVGLTEFLFLNIIAKNFVSADPNKIKRLIASTIIDWINKK